MKQTIESKIFMAKLNLIGTMLIAFFSIFIALGPILPGLTPENLPRTIQIVGGAVIALYLFQLLDRLTGQV